MDAHRHNLPAPSQPRRLGVPYHGLLSGGVLTLSNGRTIKWPTAGVVPPVSPSGDCYILRVPGTPPVQMPPAELAVEAAAGREWRNYALLVGRGRNYGGINVGTRAWLYAAPDSTVWRIECAQLDAADLRPVPADNPPQPDRWYYPATLDFHFTVRRFGVFSMDGEAATITRSCLGQSLGGAHLADPVYPNMQGYTFPRDRLYLGDGYGVQHMPINIEDVSSTGARVLFGVNRGFSQSIWPVEDPAPRAWLEVSVAGAGESITISMALLRVDVYSAPTVSSSVSTIDATIVDFVSDRGVATVVTKRDTGQTSGSLEAYLPPPVSVKPVVGAKATMAGDGRYAGAYYDADDEVQWVRAAGLYQEVRAEGGGGSTYKVLYGGTNESSDSDNIYQSRFWKIDYAWSMSGFRLTTTRGGAVMGPHAYELPELVERHQVSEVGTLDGFFDNEPPPENRYHVSRSAVGSIVGAAMGAWSYTDFRGLYNIQALIGVIADRLVSTGVQVNGAGALIPTGHFWGAPAMRSFDNVRLRRVTNKLYAVVASASDAGPYPIPYPQGNKVLALGTPDGWITTPDIADALFAAYNPGTRQVAHSPTQAVGWV